MNKILRSREGFAHIVGVFVLLVLAVALAGGVYFSQQSQEVKKSKAAPISNGAVSLKLSEILTSEGTFTPQDEVVGEVGGIKITNRDLNCLAYINYSQALASPNVDYVDLKVKVLSLAKEQAQILQIAQSRGLVDKQAVSAATDQNCIQKIKKVEMAKKALLSQDEKISGGMIAIWYHNVTMPSIPIEEAKAIAKSKITKIYNDLKSGAITFDQAIDIVKNDKELSKLDKNYTGNAYLEFKDKSTNDVFFVYKQLEDAAWKLPPGEISDIIQIPAPHVKSGSVDEEFFAIVKVFNRTNTSNGNLYKTILKK